MSVTMKINLDLYSGQEIIALIEQGLISAQEARDSGRANTLFNSDLRSYLERHELERRKQNFDQPTGTMPTLSIFEEGESND